MSFSLASITGQGGEFFLLEQRTGVIRLKKPLRDASANIYRMVITAHDGRGQRSCALSPLAAALWKNADKKFWSNLEKISPFYWGKPRSRKAVHVGLLAFTAVTTPEVKHTRLFEV